jgi:hypothetical protein
MGSWALPLVLVAERCRQETRQRFSAAWTKQFEVRCRASLT